MGSPDFNWCLTTLPILKWLQIIFSIIIIALVEACVRCWGGYGFIMFTAAFGLAFAAITLILYFFKLHTGALSSLPWRQIEIAVNIFAALCFAISFALGIYHCVELFRGNITFWFQHARLSEEEWRNRVAAFTTFSGLNMILFFLSAVYANRGFL